MSVTKQVIIRCDGPIENDECEVEPGGIRLDLGELPKSVAEAREDARIARWIRTRDGRDICPPCQKALTASP